MMRDMKAMVVVMVGPRRITYVSALLHAICQLIITYIYTIKGPTVSHRLLICIQDI